MMTRRALFGLFAGFLLACGGAGGIEVDDNEAVEGEDSEQALEASPSGGGCNGSGTSSSSSSSGTSSKTGSSTGTSSGSSSSTGAGTNCSSKCSSYTNTCKNSLTAQAPCYCAAACLYACNGNTTAARNEANKARALNGSCPY